MNLLERAKQDAKERDREKRVEEKKKRDEGRAEFEEITEKAATFVSGKLDMEVKASDLKHQEQTWIDGELAWDLTVEGLTFEVARKSGSKMLTLHQILDPEDPESESKYIRRLADLVDSK